MIFIAQHNSHPLLWPFSTSKKEGSFALKYDVYVGLSLIEIGSEANQIITRRFHSELHADKHGWPEEPFELRCEYKERTSSNPKWSSSGNAFAFLESFKIEKRTSLEAVTMVASFNGKATKGTLTFNRKN